MDGDNGPMTRTLPVPSPLDPGSRILVLGGMRVILDQDLALLYGVTTKRLNEQVKRNLDRFPPDFLLQLTAQEWAHLKSQSATSSAWGGRRTRPYAFTEHGAVMAASIINSNQAVQASVFVVRAFVRMREFLATHRELTEKIQLLEHKVGGHDESIQAVIQALKDLMGNSAGPKRPIGFGRRP